MQSFIILLPTILNVLENGFEHTDYILRDVTICLFTFFVKIPLFMTIYVFFRLICDIVDKLTYKMFKPKYIENWVEIQNKQIHDNLKKLYDRLFHLHYIVLNRDGMDKKKQIELSKNIGVISRI